jgi:hypothetical protein
MGLAIDSQMWKTQRQILEASEATNELLSQLLAEVKRANEMTRWQIERRAQIAATTV